MNTPHYLQSELYALAEADTTVFDFLQNTVLDGLWYWDLLAPDHAWISEQLWLSLGYSPEQLPTEPGAWQAIFYSDDLEAVQQQVLAGTSDPSLRSFSQTVRCFRPDGQTAWLRCWSLLVRNEAGQPARLLVALLNVTREKQEEIYAREVAQHYSSILSNQSVYIIKTDAQGNYTFVNDLFYERFGYDSKILGTQSLLSIIEADRPKCLAVVMQCFVEPEVPHQVILRKPYKDGSVKSNHWEFKGLRNAQGEVTEILCVGYDVTLLTESLERTRHLLEVSKQQNQRLQNFAYIVSHNIRSHSANLTSLVRLLGHGAGEEHQAKMLQMLQTSTAKLAETIANLNEIVAINTSGPLNKEPRLLRAEITKTLEALRVQLEEHQIGVQVEVQPEVVVPVVPAYLDSILLNLLSNAIKYRSPERPLLIRLYSNRHGGYTVLAVEDNGLGIDLVKNRDKLFGMYKTFHGNADARGMGLFISKSQLEAMQGKIEVESKPGVGSTFKVYFDETA